MERNNPRNLGNIDVTDFGPEPLIINLNNAARMNPNYRTALWTGTHLQLTLMSLPIGGDIGLEVHPETDQYLRVESGVGLAKMGSDKERLNYQKQVRENDVIFVPAGTWHNVVNTGSRSLKLSSVYAPPQHPHGTVHRTKAEAQAGETQY